MGVLIKGMDMPTSCLECPLTDGHSASCLITEKSVYFSVNKRHDGCPLIPVPPHGDLIDRREAIIDANERAYDFWLSDDEVNATIQFLNEQTTIIPESEEGE